jgi:hypothetical protein
MHWKVKGFMQKALSVTPGGMWLNTQLQQAVGQRQNFDEHIEIKMQDWADMCHGVYRKFDVPFVGAEMVEVGTGWFPVLPLCFYLVGARRTITFDLYRHLKMPETLQAIQVIGRSLDFLAKMSGVSLDQVQQRFLPLSKAASAMEALQLAGIEYRAPADASATQLPPNSVDTVYSNSVFEHIPNAIISAILVESQRILKLGGTSIHSVNCGDHYAYFDKNVSFANYLQFNEKDWSMWNNELLYQNRMRPQDFFDAAEKGGLALTTKLTFQKPETVEALKTLKVAPQFHSYSPKDLASHSVTFIGTKPS